MKGLMDLAGKGVLWKMAAQFVQQLIQLGTLAILARSLEPSDFGIVGMAMIFTAAFQPFRQWGFQASLIQKQAIGEEDKNTAFWSVAATGLALFLVTLLLSPLSAHIFHEQKVSEIVFWLAFGFLLSPFGSIQWAMLTRELKFKTIAMRDVFASVVYGASASVLAVCGMGVWSIVIAMLARETAWSFFLWFSYKWKPAFKFNLQLFRESLHFSANTSGLGVVNYLMGNLDSFVIGRFLGAAPLGHYSVAFNTVSQPQMKIVSQVVTVTFPAYSMIRDDRERTRQAYLRMMRMILLVTVPLLAILFVCADDFVLFFYGTKWQSAAVLIRIMCLYGLIRSVVSISGAIFLSQGQPGMDLRLMLGRLAMTALFLIPSLRYGVVGISYAILLSSFVTFFPAFHTLNRLMGVKNSDFYVLVGRYLGYGVLLVGSLFLVRPFFGDAWHAWPVWLRMAIYVALGGLIYRVLLYCFSEEDVIAVTADIRKLFQK